MKIEKDLTGDSEVLKPREQAQSLGSVDPDQVILVPQIETLLTGAACMLQLAQREVLRRLEGKGSLDPATVRAVSALVDASTKLSKEDRLRSKEFADGLSSMDDDELLELLEAGDEDE